MTYLSLFALFFIIVFYYLLYRSNPPKRKYIIREKVKFIRWFKLTKCWCVIQVVVLLCSINNPMLLWYDIILIPVLLILIILFNRLLTIMDSDVLLVPDYDEKVEER